MKAFARHTDPYTSHDAAASLGETSITVLERKVENGIKEMGNHGATWDDLHQITGLPMQSISPRFEPLMKKGRIYRKNGPDGKALKRKGKSGRGQVLHFHISSRGELP